jgi:hypothetical protein
MRYHTGITSKISIDLKINHHHSFCFMPLQSKVLLKHPNYFRSIPVYFGTSDKYECFHSVYEGIIQIVILQRRFVWGELAVKWLVDAMAEKK